MNHITKNTGELFFKSLALGYTEKSGNELQKELAEISRRPADAPPFSFDAFDIRVKSRIKTDRIKKWTARLMPLAACFIVFLAYIALADNFLPSSPDGIPPQMLTYEFIETKLPAGYTLQKLDYDRQKAIYYIDAENENKIVLTVERFEGDMDTEGFDIIPISGTYAYGVAKTDFSFLQYKKDGLLYTMTTPAGYADLIRLGENLV